MTYLRIKQNCEVMFALPEKVHEGSGGLDSEANTLRVNGCFRRRKALIDLDRVDAIESAPRRPVGTVHNACQPFPSGNARLIGSDNS